MHPMIVRIARFFAPICLCATLVIAISACKKGCTPGRTLKGGTCILNSELDGTDAGAADAAATDAATRESTGSKRNAASAADRDRAASEAGRAGSDEVRVTEHASMPSAAAGASGGSAVQPQMSAAIAGAGGHSAGAAGGVAVCMQECCRDATCAVGATCEQGKCQCPNGQHVCNGVCVDNRSPATCGAGCEACVVPMGGEAICDGIQCGSACPPGTRLCAGACIGESMPCNNVCPQGSHNCSDNCIEVTSVTACGDSCMPCAVPAHSKATCDGSACGFVCSTGYKACGDVCIESEGCCSSSDCNASNSEQCNANSHRCECRAGLKSCQGRCIDETACCSSSDCSSGKVCDTATHVCECASDSKECDGKCISRTACCAGADTGNRCTSGSTSGVCNASGRCVECVAESDCSSQDEHCDTQRNVCVECRNANDCPGGEFARCEGGKCTEAEGCGNGKIDGDDECDVGAVGAPGTARWSSTTCTTDCKALIYITSTSDAAGGCTSPRVSNDITQCTLSCSSDADCPALGGYPRAECNITGKGTCQIPCSANNDCLTRTGTTCMQLMGIPSMPFVCANPGF